MDELPVRTKRERKKHIKTRIAIAKPTVPACKGETRRRKPAVKKPRETLEQPEGDEEDDLYDERAIIYQDENFKSEDLQEAGKIIKKIYLEVEKEYDRRVEDELKNVFLPLVGGPRHTCHLDDKPETANRPAFSLTPVDHAIRYKTSTVFRYTPEEESQTLLCAILDGGDALPPMQYWVHIETNVMSEDNLRLSHVPYLDEEQNDEQICEDLRYLFEDGIHGWSDNWKYINDAMLYDVLDKAHVEYDGDEDVLYFAFYQLFPNKYSARQLPEIFDDLSERWEDIKKIGDVQTKMPAYPPDEKTDGHSLRTLKCLQCASFDCVHHGLHPEIPENLRSGRWFLSDLPVPGSENMKNKEECSKECWKSIPRQDVLDYLKVTEDAVVNGKIQIYHGLDETLRLPAIGCSILMIAFSRCDAKLRDNFCLFAKNHHTKFSENWTCKEAYNNILKCAKRPAEERLFFEKEPVKVDASTMHRQFRTLTWANNVKGKIENQYRLDPCNHKGPCGGDNKECICVKNGVCTKFCECDDSCKMKFPGCRCGPGQCRTRSCQCFYAKWECDPVLCKSCNCDTFGTKDACRNSAIANGAQKKIKVLPSLVAGWGAYMMESAEKGDLISEYTGEVISTGEVERRGHIYDKLKISYIFGLNDDQCIDANRMGNMIRFANHAESCDSNCYSKILIVNGQHHIGIFAKRDLQIGEEILFDYSYNKKHREEFVANNRFGETKKSKEKSKKSRRSQSVPADNSDNEDVKPKKEDLKVKKDAKDDSKKPSTSKGAPAAAKKRGGAGGRKRKL